MLPIEIGEKTPKEARKKNEGRGPEFIGKYTRLASRRQRCWRRDASDSRFVNAELTTRLSVQ